MTSIFFLCLLTFILSRCFAAARLALAAQRAYDGAPWSTTDTSKWVVVCAVVTLWVSLIQAWKDKWGTPS